MAEARAMARSDVYNRPRRNSDYASNMYTYTNNNLWQTGKSRVEIVTNMARVVSLGVNSRIRRMKTAIVNAVFPSTTFTWYTSLGTACVLRQYVPQAGEWMDKLPYMTLVPEGLARDAASVFVSGTLLWLAGIQGSRLGLRLLLRYKGFLYEPAKRPSWQTLSWLFLVRLLEGFGKPMTYSFQRVLPTLPVPSLRDTCRRYLESARPLLDDAEYDRMCRLAEEFQANEGPGFQRWLKVKSWVVSNYVSDWWERFVYLRSRESLMINSNYYIMDAYGWSPTSQQTARAANMISMMMLYKRKLDRCEIEPLLLQGTVPLCMAQHERTFGTTRIPCLEEDVIQHVHNTKHIAILSHGAFYVISIFDPKGVRLSPRDIEMQLDWIIKDSITNSAEFAAAHLPAMTAADRDVWATFRDEHMGEGVTRASLEAIERAAFVVVLDDSSPSNPSYEKWQEGNPVAKALLHGNGSNRWFDKSITLVVFANGKSGVNCEHTWADAPVAAHCYETAMAAEFAGAGYDDETGRNKAVPQPKTNPKPPLRLRFEFTPEAEEIIKREVLIARTAIDDLDHRLFLHDDYSKGFMKKCKFSPDGWLQMMLQLAYFRDKGCFHQTYEASMTRLYRDGRTETVRPVTVESAAFVRAMDDENSSKEERVALLRKAVTHHVQLFKDAMAGKGIDRHLFCLYVVSNWRKINSPFLNEVLSVPWSLSTSQTPVQQTALFDLKNNLNKISAGGGFGPVTDDGYGVSYIISSDSLVSFHVTSKVSSDKTDSTRFVNHIKQAMADMKALFE